MTKEWKVSKVVPGSCRLTGCDQSVGLDLRLPCCGTMRNLYFNLKSQLITYC